MNGTPKRTLQITPTQPASTRNRTQATSRRSSRPGKTQPTPRPEGRRANPQSRRPHQKPAGAPDRGSRRPQPQSRPRKPGMEQIARLAVSAVTALAQLLNAIHRIRTGHGAS